MLPEAAIKEFKESYEKEYGVSLSFEEASLRAHAIIKLYKAVCLEAQEMSDDPSTPHGEQTN